MESVKLFSKNLTKCGELEKQQPDQGKPDSSGEESTQGY